MSVMFCFEQIEELCQALKDNKAEAVMRVNRLPIKVSEQNMTSYYRYKVSALIRSFQTFSMRLSVGFHE